MKKVPHGPEHLGSGNIEANIKASNPKDAIGVLKVGLSYVPIRVVYEVALGMFEGALKYRRHNYRVIGVRASVYYDATKRHLDAWWEGEDQDPHSGAGLHHVSKAIASLVVLRDAMLQGKFQDDRPPKVEPGWQEQMSQKIAEMAATCADPQPPYTATGGDK